MRADNVTGFNLLALWLGRRGPCGERQAHDDRAENNSQPKQPDRAAIPAGNTGKGLK